MTHHIQAELGCGGNLFQSGNFRSHDAGGRASITLTKHDWWRDIWTLRIGLRNRSGVQVTQSLEFKPSSRTAHAFTASAGGLAISDASLAVNARVATNGNGSCLTFPPTFEGDLTQ
jgi:hypothetical protein